MFTSSANRFLSGREKACASVWESLSGRPVGPALRSAWCNAPDLPELTPETPQPVALPDRDGAPTWRACSGVGLAPAGRAAQDALTQPKRIIEANTFNH